ncbi:MAG: SIMPL domain-containing protein [Anaerolineae bacterium]|nr:SIMPL domain-containing protein [Anaerolineae bacterium]
MFTSKQYRSWKMVGLMGVALIAVLVLATGCTGGSLASPAGAGNTTNRITVSGSGQAYGKPDVAYVDLGIDVTNTSISPALTQANQVIDDVQAAVKEAGIAEEDIQTTNFSVYPEDRYDPQTGQPTGERIYHVQNVLRITVRDVSKVGNVIDAGTGAGANTVHNVSFSILDTQDLADQARTEAVADAKERAQQLADGFDVKLGGATLISESYDSVPVVLPAADFVGKGGGAPVSSGQLVVSVQVNVTFNLIP